MSVNSLEFKMGKTINPVKPKMKSIAASVVCQSRVKLAATSNVVPLDEKRLSQTKIYRGVDDGGMPFIKAIFHNPGGIPFEEDLSFTLDFPNLSEPFSLGFLEWGSSLGNISRVKQIAKIKSNFFAFLSETELMEIDFNQLDEQFFVTFKKWLDRPRKNGQPCSPMSRRKIIGCLRSIFLALEKNPMWSAQARQVVEAMPRRIYPGAHIKTEPTEVLNREHLIAIIKACEHEFIALQKRWLDGRKFLKKGNVELAKGSQNYRDLATCLAALDKAYPGVVPCTKVIRQDNNVLAMALLKNHSSGELTGYLYPSARDLVPLVLLVSVFTVFNPDTTLTLVRSNIVDELDRVGTPAIKVTGIKGRASEDQVRLLDASVDGNKLNLPALFNLLSNMTARLRNSISIEKHKDRVFVFVQLRGAAIKQAKSFGNVKENETASHDRVWRHGLENFIKKHDLTPFTLNQIRPTLLDFVQYLSGNLEDAQSVGGHKNLHTTWKHYTSSGTKKRYQERVGEIIVFRERWYQTYGVIDPRLSTITQDKGAATPGFTCLDPFDSPLANQINGQLCKAYGECPSCPLAAANLGDSANVALYIALKSAIYRSQGSMAPKTWLQRWAPVIQELNTLLEITSEAVLAKASEYSIKLPLVG